MRTSRESSARGGRAAKNERGMKARKIDFSDIPRLSDEQLGHRWRVGRPPLGEQPKKLIAIRLDQRVLNWVKRAAAKQDRPYQAFINEILEREMKKAG